MAFQFNPKDAFNKIREQQLAWMEKVGVKKVVFGVSGGKDSSCIAWLEAKILGPDNTVGVMMPNGLQKDIGDSMQVVKETKITSYAIDIGNAFNALVDQLHYNGLRESDDTKINLPPRLRMSTLYAVAQTVGGVVLNTDNLDEVLSGYYTIFGDGAGSYGPLRNLTVSEVIALGKWLGIPDNLINKKPGDGLQALGDEDRLGFKYVEMDKLIRENEATDEVRAKVMDRFMKNKFKTEIVNIPAPEFGYPNFVIGA